MHVKSMSCLLWLTLQKLFEMLPVTATLHVGSGY
jgi:hypothetical protein